MNFEKSCKQILVIFLFLTVSCGPNSFKSFEKADPAEDATVALERGDPQKAIDLLTDALVEDPSNQKYISILALAYAQRAGVDPLTLAQNMGSSSSSGTSGNGVTGLFSIMPVATEAAIADVDYAVTLLLTIPSADRKTYDTLKLAMFQTAALTLRSKILDVNGDGILSTEELLAMTPASAIAMLSQLANAATAFAGGSSTSTTDVAAAAKITAIQTAISAEEGANDSEKLKNYLGRTSS